MARPKTFRLLPILCLFCAAIATASQAQSAPPTVQLANGGRAELVGVMARDRLIAFAASLAARRWRGASA